MSRVGWVVAAATAAPFVVGVLVGAPPAPEADVAFTFTDPDIVESSGLVLQGGLAVTMNDSGDGARVFTVDPTSGDTVGTTTWDADVVDLESLAPLGDGEVLVGDTGGNLVARDEVALYRVPVGAGTTTAEVEPGTWRYPDGAHDAEALLVEPGGDGFLLVSKGVLAGTVYEGSVSEGSGTLRDVGTVLPLVTDGAFLPDGRHLVLRDYTQAVVYAWPDLTEEARFDLPTQEQGEGLAVAPDGGLYVSSEGQYSDVLRVDPPRAVQRLLDGGDGGAGPSSSATDDADGVPAQADDAPAEPARPAWPWLVGGAAGLVVIGVLLVALRPR